MSVPQPAAGAFSSEGPIARRPDVFRALGPREPPDTIEIRDRSYRRVSILKHDSWAATAVYSDDAGSSIACKFNRVHRLFGVPMAWLGRRLARREEHVFQRLTGVMGFPRWSGPIVAGGRHVPHAVAHAWIEGRTFKPWLPVDAAFFPRLEAMLDALHARGIAYMDMSKWENILIGDDGRPYLVDYQVHVRLPRVWPLRWMLRQLQDADRYYLRRHWARTRPDQLSAAERDLSLACPLVVRLCEPLGAPWRWLRGTVLRSCGVRTDARRGTAN